MVFQNRQQAALQLVTKLEAYRGKSPLVLAIPRGAVPMADAIVNSLGGEMDLVLVAKIASSRNPEYALGAVSESGSVHLTEPASITASQFERPDELEAVVSQSIARLRERRATYAPLVSRVDPRGRVVIVVDDGIATGATMGAAVESLRLLGPARIIVATPVASVAAVRKLSSVADEIVVLSVPEDFRAVSQFYEDFRQVSDEEVIHLLSESRKKKPLQDAYQRGATQIFEAH